MTARRPSKPWRVIYATPEAPVYETHRSQVAAYQAVETEKQRVADGHSSITLMVVEQWNINSQRWQRYENVWSKSDPKEGS